MTKLKEGLDPGVLTLSSLIHPLTVEQFFEHLRTHTPFVCHYDLDDLEKNQDQSSAIVSSLMRLDFLKSVETLLAVWPAEVEVHLPLIRDEISAVQCRSHEALEFYRHGMGLLFKNVEKKSELLEKSLKNLQNEIGFSALTLSRCLVYATPDGKGTAPHFDQNYNIVVQLRGVKKWKCSPNVYVENPLVRHTLGQEPEVELATYLDQEFPKSSGMPPTIPSEGLLEFELKPGSVLFVPRGVWHSTEAEGDALALNFTFTAPSWLDLFLAALRSRLALSSEWRETVSGLQDPEKRELSSDQLGALLQLLKEDLPEWESSDILDVTDPFYGSSQK